MFLQYNSPFCGLFKPIAPLPPTPCSTTFWCPFWYPFRTTGEVSNYQEMVLAYGNWERRLVPGALDNSDRCLIGKTDLSFGGSLERRVKAPWTWRFRASTDIKGNSRTGCAELKQNMR